MKWTNLNKQKDNKYVKMLNRRQFSCLLEVKRLHLLSDTYRIIASLDKSIPYYVRETK